jgi:hypothetical protein
LQVSVDLAVILVIGGLADRFGDAERRLGRVFLGFVRIAGPNMGVKERIEVPVEAVVDPAATGRPMDGVPQAGHVLQEVEAVNMVEVVELTDQGVGEQQRVAFQILPVAHHGETAPHAGDHFRVLAVSEEDESLGGSHVQW